MFTCLSSVDNAQPCIPDETTYSCSKGHTFGSTSLGRILLVIDGELGCTLTPFGLGNDIHHPGDVEAASEPGRLGCDWVN